MRALTSKEKRLLVGLLGALFVLVNVIGLQTLLNRQRDLRSNIGELRQQIDFGDALLAEKDYWAERAAWLAENQPTDDTATTQDDEKFYDFIESSARESGLEFAAGTPGAAVSQGAYVQINYSAKVKGKLQALIKWLNLLQQPKEFRAIRQISIKSDAEPPGIVCDIDVARWYRPLEEKKP
ncbi:MAG: hypothetical protein ACOYOL_06255 [Chthoniobacterales bacterium]